MCEYEIKEYKMLMKWILEYSKKKWILEAREREIWGKAYLSPTLNFFVFFFEKGSI